MSESILSNSHLSFDEHLRRKNHKELWNRYCGFLDLSVSEFMSIQEQLLLEQIQLFNKCELGKKLFNNQSIHTVEDFRKKVPLTHYEDYADILLSKQENMLPAPTAIWIETTWVGGKAPIKLAPYTEAMIRNYRDSAFTCIMLASSRRKGHFDLKPGMNFLNGMAPLPYLTGLLPDVIRDDFSVNYFPPIEEGLKMSFSQRNKEGFKMGVQQGLDLFYGLSSVIVRMSEQFAQGSSGNTNLLDFKMSQLGKFAQAKLRSTFTKEPIYPKDVFDLKGFVCIGTDTLHFKKKIADYWGVVPLEVFGGTEPTCIGVESWEKDGLIFLPHICFYEFIPMHEFYKNLDDPSYQPKTYLMDELKEDESYELVITTFKGGAFARYRVGDVFKCEVLERMKDGIALPHLRYIDRVDPVVDLAGFTRITEETLTEVIKLSRLPISNWFARKCYDEAQRPYLNLALELNHKQDDLGWDRTDLIQAQLELNFAYVDQDFKNLKKMLGIDPLTITILPFGTIDAYQKTINHKLAKVNPNHFDVVEILKRAFGRDKS